MPVDPVEVPKPKGMTIKDTNEKNILVIEDISKENIIIRTLIWIIIRLMR